MTALRSNVQRAKWVQTLLYVNLRYAVVALLLYLGVFLSLDLQWFPIPGMTPTVFELVRALLVLGSFGLMLTTAVVFLAWIYRNYYNLISRIPEVQFPGLRLILSWIIPVINFIRPFLLMQEILNYTQQLIAEVKPAFQSQVRMQNLWLWWFFWIATQASLFWFWDFSLLAAQHFTTNSIVYIAWSGLIIPAAWYGLLVVKSYHRLELDFLEADELRQKGMLPTEENNTEETAASLEGWEVYPTEFGPEKPLFPED